MEHGQAKRQQEPTWIGSFGEEQLRGLLAFLILLPLHPGISVLTLHASWKMGAPKYSLTHSCCLLG